MTTIPDRGAVLLAVGSLLAALTCGVAIAELPSDAISQTSHWVLLAVLAASALALVVWAARHDELLAPLGVLAMTMLFYFVVRPLELAMSAGELVGENYNYYATPLETINSITGQEISLFVHTRMSGDFEAAMGRATLAVTLFFLLALAGYVLPVAGHLAERAARIGSGMKHNLEVRWVVVAWLALGVLGQALILRTIGGLGVASTQLGTQGNLASLDFSLLTMLNFYTAGLVMWISWHPPRGRGAQVALGLALFELSAFYMLLGSRTLVIVPVLLIGLAWSETIKPWRIRTLFVGAIVGLFFASAYLTLREDTRNRPFSEAIKDVPANALNARTILNSSPVFDQLFMETNFVPEQAPYRYGGELSQAVRGNLPGLLYEGKPESTDVTFRKLIWGDRFLAGRPTGAAGEFYRDFGFPGIVVGSLLFGIFARGLSGLRARAGGEAGRPLRIALFVVGLLLLYQVAIGSYSLVVGSALAIGIPLFLGLKVFARSR